MGRLLYTDNIGFDMRDWERLPIKEVFAGTNCIMAITEDGRTLQKIKNRSFAARTQYWTRITQISLSNCLSGHAIGLVCDGTCLISKRPLRYLTDRRNFEGALSFEWVNDKVRSWTGIVQVAVSDAYFALDEDGRVHYAATHRYEESDYSVVTSWRDVKKIVTANQNGVLGITKDGKVLCAGGNFTRDPSGYTRKRLSKLSGVVDACVTGSEAEQVIVALDDGSIVEVFQSSEPYEITSAYLADRRPSKLLDSFFDYTVCCVDSNGQLQTTRGSAPFKPVVFSGDSAPQEPVSVSSFAVKDRAVIAVAAD